jgi:GTPase
MDLVERIFRADPRAIARAMSVIENGEASAREILRGIFPKTGRGLAIGMTGAPGSGKSTLVDKLALAYRTQNRSVGIVAVDPTSPFSGGAMLADRIRMQSHYNDSGVFIRSMATRGKLGGLARATKDIVSVLDAAGKEIILIETVGVGQDEIEIVKVADISVVVLVPGMGDELQAFKSGIMEIGDIFVINKADRPQVEKIERELEFILSLAVRSDGWKPTIVKTVATQGEGISDLIQAIDNFNQFRRIAPRLIEERKQSIQEDLLEILKDLLLEKAVQENGVWDRIRAASEEVKARKKDPYTAVEQIVQSFGAKP